MDEKLTKSLTDLIDETLQELEELRKSRFAATEIKLEGPGEGIAGKPSDGELSAKKSEEEEEKEEKKKEDMDKAEENDEEAEEAEDKAKTKDMKKKEDKDEEDEDEDEEKHPHKKETAKAAKDILEMHKYEMKKSLEESESLIKSYVEERVKPLEDKLSTILDLVNRIAEQPVAPKGVSARTAPLLKSAAEEAYVEPLSKSEVASKLFELKKSGTEVDSLDIAKVEMGQDLTAIVKKYNIQ